MKYFNEFDTFKKAALDENLKIFKNTFFPWDGDYERLENVKLGDSLTYLGVDSTTLIETLNDLKDRLINDQNFEQIVDGYLPLYIFNISKDAKTIIVIPGGGYEKECYLNEGFMVSHTLNKLGYNAIVISYRVSKDAKYPNPFIDATASIKYLFNNKDKLNLNLDNYALMGFSAGGHLAASIVSEKQNLDFIKPHTLILGYPVISLEKYTHLGTCKNLLQEEIDNIELRKKYSINNLVTKNYPNTYLWQCDNDNCVPFENSIILAKTLNEFNIPYEFKIYHSEIHGLGIGINTVCDKWILDALNFYQKGL